MLRENPHLRYADSRKRGYVVIELGAARATARLRGLDSEKDPDSGVATQITRSPQDARASGDALHQHFCNTLDPSLMAWSTPVLVCAATAATGDVKSARRQFAGAQTAAARGADNDGLPDLLIPVAALAWALNDVEVARRLLTVVRRSPTPTQNFLLTIVYQQLRDEVGLLDHNPLEDSTVEDICREAIDWLSNLSQNSVHPVAQRCPRR